MDFGVRLRRLSEMKVGLAGCLVIALIAAVWSLESVSLLPPKLTPRSLEMATASTHAVVDTPRSTLLDLRQDTYELEGLTKRAVLLGNVIANGPVKESIARQVGIPVTVLRVDAPLTAKQPRARVEAGNEKKASDILKSNNQYRLNIQANPTAPMLDIYAQTPTARSAEALANAAVKSLQDYLDDLARTQRTPEEAQIRLVQLGTARGTVINEGVHWQVAFLAFVLTFAFGCATLIFLSRVSRGWRIESLSERAAASS
jgi:hypothetical protein